MRHANRPFRPGLLPAALLVVLFALVACPAWAQFQVRQQAGFEDGRLPAGAIVLGASRDTPVETVEAGQVPGMSDRFSGGEAAAVIGRHVLRLRSSVGGPNSGLLLDSAFDREQIPENGYALFQADFYLPDAPEQPSLAVLLMEPPADDPSGFPESLPSVRGAYYRFGMTMGQIPYFSCVQPGKDRPVSYQNDRQVLSLIPKPGWHRFAMHFTRMGEISCYIDGREMVYSPTREVTVRRMLIGVLLADGKRSYDCYADNISLQVSDGSLPFPESPYASGWNIPPGEAVRANAVSPSSRAIRDLRWLDPLHAWKAAQDARKPLLLFFYSPDNENSERVNKLFFADRAASAWLDRTVRSRVDITTAQGSAIARRYEVFRVPTLLLIAPDEKSHARVVPALNEPWRSIAVQLSSALNGEGR